MIPDSERIPLISVVMPVYNGEKYLAEAIQSILDQTFTDFEFIILDDGSSDSTISIIRGYKDSRIFLKQFSDNKGDSCRRNTGMKIAKGKYICAMDADDICEPERLQKQFEFMELNPDTGLCGTHVENIPSGILTTFSTDYEKLKVEFLSNNFCVHPSLILRKEFLYKFNIWYNENYYCAGDYDLCARALQHFKIQNVPDVLLRYRRHPGQISATKINDQIKEADEVRVNQLIDILGFSKEEIPVLLHLKLMKKQPIKEQHKIKAEQWVLRILEKNKNIGFYDKYVLRDFLLTCISFS